MAETTFTESKRVKLDTMEIVYGSAVIASSGDHIDVSDLGLGTVRYAEARYSTASGTSVPVYISTDVYVVGTGTMTFAIHAESLESTGGD